MAKRNFLLGRGERLTQDVVIRSGGGPKAAPYTFSEARQRLTPMLERAVARLDALPPEACPDDRAVATVTLNPEYIAKSYFPFELLRATGIEAVGSKPRRITPQKRSKGREPEETLTTELFVMGPRQAFRNWQRAMPRWTENTAVANDLLTIEEISAPVLADKLKGPFPKTGKRVFEVILHADGASGSEPVDEFADYLEGLGVRWRSEHKFFAGGLCFVEVEAPAGLAGPIATLSIVRAVREMPRLRVLQPAFRTAGVPSAQAQFPTSAAMASNIRTAIFDGGVPSDHPITQWVNPIDAPGVGPAIDTYLDHGVGVSSAFLFGHITPGQGLAAPYSNVDHYRVLDDQPGQNPRELFEVLARIESVLDNHHYDFINLSVGPSLSIEDDEIHAWTAVLDEHLASSDTLAAIAVGNNGEGDAATQFNRVQVPSDCVNGLAIGSADTPDKVWARSPYSSVGPGRSPGVIKPDLVDFGGSIQRPFIVVGADSSARLQATGGTSFATPAVLRLAAGVRAHFGSGLNLLAVRTLLTHTAHTSDHSMLEVGWGRVARDLDEIVLVDDDTIRVMYQGKISPAKYVRAPIPFPDGVIQGKVEITATLCYKCSTDPNHPGNYTRAGLEPTFRPHDGRYTRDDQVHPDSKGFFSPAKTGAGEDELRRDAWKWENCLHAKKGFLGTSLHNPCFDIHYNARQGGQNHKPSGRLSYALAVTVRAKAVGDLYDQVVRKYATILEPLRPIVDIPVRV